MKITTYETVTILVLVKNTIIIQHKMYDNNL